MKGEKQSNLSKKSYGREKMRAKRAFSMSGRSHARLEKAYAGYARFYIRPGKVNAEIEWPSSHFLNRGLFC